MHLAPSKAVVGVDRPIDAYTKAIKGENGLSSHSFHFSQNDFFELKTCMHMFKSPSTKFAGWEEGRGV